MKHSEGEYARGDATTNTVERHFSILKRGLISTFCQVGEQHLRKYVNEFDFHYNYRAALGVEDAARAGFALIGITGMRLTYRKSDRH